MPVFDVQGMHHYEGHVSAAIKRPKEIAHFSYDENHLYHADARSLRYYYPPTLNADLCKGFESFRQLDDSKDEHLDSLLQTIMNLEKETGEKVDADIITWRGMMTKIMATPRNFVMGSSFEMNATLFQGTIFIEENHEHKLSSRASQSNQWVAAQSQDLMSYWGYKFETLSLLPNTWDATSRDYIESRERLVVDNYAQYCSVVRTGFGDTKLCIGGEVDAVWGQKPNDTSKPIPWVELKTTACIENDRDMLKFERKLQKFWIQSFLLGVPTIIVGFRTAKGILHHIEELETQNIPSQVKKRGKGSWDGNLSINFTAAFLQWLRSTITSEGLWRIRRKDKGKVIEVFQETTSGHGNILTQEFVDWRQSRTKSTSE